MDFIFKDIGILTMDPDRPFIQNGCVGISQGRIAAVSDRPLSEEGAEIYEGRGKLLMPGLINTHSHLPMTLLRGYADDFPLQEWLSDHIWPAEGKLTARAVALGAELAVAELLAGGVTSVSEMYYFLPEIFRVVQRTGIKCNMTNALLCLDEGRYDFARDRSTQEVLALIPEAKNSGGRIRIEAGLHGEYTSFPRAWADVCEFSDRWGLDLQLHLSETDSETQACIARHGATPVAVLERAGLFDRHTTAAHCCHLYPEDFEILADKGVCVAHCPVSNAKLASGIAPVPQMIQRGICVSIGTDGMASNNSFDMFEEMKFAALTQKNATHDPSILPAMEVLHMATTQGAKTQNRAGECGMIRAGMDADCVVIDLSAAHLFPVFDPASAIVYAGRSSDVVLTMVQGQILYRDGNFSTIDIERIKHEIEKEALPLFGRKTWAF